MHAAVSQPGPTQRLTFRWWREDDAPLAQALWGDAQVTARIGRVDPRVRLSAEVKLARDHRVQYWPIFAGEAFVGCCGLRPYRTIYELGFHLCATQWGKGYATEAARAVIAHAFEMMNAPALFAGHHPENEPSRRTLLKLGFRYTHDEPYAATGLRHPSYELVRTSSPAPRASMMAPRTSG
jgi:RimJ/RimL family protein N-acetyltransferase